MASRLVVEAFKNYKHYIMEGENEIKRKVMKAKANEKIAVAKERLTNMSAHRKLKSPRSRNGTNDSRLSSSRLNSG